MEEGFYYLHTNGELIWKRFRPEDDSDFVRRIWPIDVTNRLHAWRILLDAAYLGANIERIRELAKKWDVSVMDLPKYLAHEENVTNERRKGLRIFCQLVWNVNYDALMDFIAKTPKGKHPDMTQFTVGKGV